MDLNTVQPIEQNETMNDTNTKKVRTTIYLPVDLHKSAKIYCARNDISLTQFIINFLRKTIYTGNN